MVDKAYRGIEVVSLGNRKIEPSLFPSHGE